MAGKSTVTKDYVVLLKQGDKGFLRDLYLTVLPNVKTYVLKNSGTTDDAHDIFHNALETLIISAHQGRLNISGDIDPYLFRICRNKWIDSLRKKSKLPQVSIEEDRRELKEEAEEYETLEKNKRLKTALDGTYALLSTTCQELIRMVQDGIDMNHIMNKLGMASANTVYRRKFACMKRWRELLLSNQDYQSYKSYHEQ